MNNKKVSEITFHINRNEFDDFLLRAGKLVEEGYTLQEIECDTINISHDVYSSSPYVHVNFRRKY